MGRVRGVGKQAAGSLDFLQKRDLDAFELLLPNIYVQRSLFNQPQGVPQLDVNSRMANTNLPTDISRTTLTASGKTKGGSLEITGAGTIGTTLGVTGALTAGSSVVSGNGSVGGSLSVVGAITGASVNVGNGAVTALTADIPEIITATFKAKATTLDSLTVTGQTLTGALTTTGDIATQSVAAVAVTATGAITASGPLRGATVKSDGSLTVDGASALQAVTIAGAAIANSTLTAAGQLRANGGLRLGVSQSISQVDGSNNAVPVVFSNGLVAGGALSGVSTLNTSGAVTVGGALSATGKGTFGDLQSNSNLAINGTLTGVSDLSITGNLNVLGAGKKISATEVSASILSSTSGLSIGATLLPTDVHLTLNSKQMRMNGNRFERYASSRWVPVQAGAMFTKTISGATFAVANTTVTELPATVTVDNEGQNVLTSSGNAIWAYVTGYYLVSASVTLTMLQSRQATISLRINGTADPYSTVDYRTGLYPDNPAGSTGWGYLSMHISRVLKITAGQYVSCYIWQGTGFSSDVISNTVWKPSIQATFLGAAT